MNIGEAARASGVSAKMVRYYESIGLIAKVRRSGSGYRLYTGEDVNTLRFIHRARGFGFPIERIRVLVGLWREGRPSREVKQLALEHAAALDARIIELTAMRDALRELAATCHGDGRPECPILQDLQGAPGPAPRVARTAPADVM